jgi:hypothetical protein
MVDSIAPSYQLKHCSATSSLAENGGSALVMGKVESAQEGYFPCILIVLNPAVDLDAHVSEVVSGAGTIRFTF